MRYLKSAGYVWLSLSLLFGAYTMSQVANMLSQCEYAQGVSSPRLPWRRAAL